MGDTFGVMTKAQSKVEFSNIRAEIVQGEENTNFPDNSGSPNRSRVVGRLPGYSDPVLGDAGVGEIGRWKNYAKLDALESVVDQIIEHYIRDKEWYAGVRGREALWNVYKRLAWWVSEEMDPSRGDYQQALNVIRDCMKQILEDSQDPNGIHMGVELPFCPAPYPLEIHKDYLNHFDGADSELRMYALQDEPLLTSFPGLFRYISSLEDQEWEIVHSVGGDERTGTENVMKVNLDNLRVGNSSKITCSWKFKQRGFVRFKYLASTIQGNGLTFFVNNSLVGGEWSENADWEEVSLNVRPGQTYKFDWLIRKQADHGWGNNSVYIKDVEFVEVVVTSEPPTPPDADVIGAGEGFGYDPWITRSSSSKARAEFFGESLGPLDMVIDLDSDCDGELSFSYKMGTSEPFPDRDYVMMYDEKFQGVDASGHGQHGSSATCHADDSWAGGSDFSTKENNAKIICEIIVGDGCKIDGSGVIELVCPERVIDYYEPTTTTPELSPQGKWVSDLSTGGMRADDLVEGYSVVTKTVSTPDGGWFQFSVDHDLRSTETFMVTVDSLSVYISKGISYREGVVIPLKAGAHDLRFYLNDSHTEGSIVQSFAKTLVYNRLNDYFASPLGSWVAVSQEYQLTRKGIAGVTFSTDGATLSYSVLLNAGASFSITQGVVITHDATPPWLVTTLPDTMIFEEVFNVNGVYSSRLSFSPNWEWEDIATRENQWAYGDGVMKVEGKNGSTNTVMLMASLFTDGYVFFQYGGIFAPFEYLELFMDGVSIWKGNRSSYLTGEDITVPIPAGEHLLKWVYIDVGGTTVPIPGNVIVQSENSVVETCYPSGSQNSNLGYSADISNSSTPRTSQVAWGGVGQTKYTDGAGKYIAHGTTSDGAIVTRDIWTPEFANYSYSELLKVYAGSMDTSFNGMKQLKVSLNQNTNRKFPLATVSKNGYYGLHLRNVDPGVANSPFFSNYTERFFQRVWTDGDLEISFKYMTFIRDQRKCGRFRVLLYPENEPSITQVILDENDNKGDNLFQHYLGINDWSGAEKKTFSLSGLAPGWYVLNFGLTDIISGYDSANGVDYYAVFRDLIIQTQDVNSMNGSHLVYAGGSSTQYDNTYVELEIIDKSTGGVVSTTDYPAGNSGVGQYPVSFTGLKPGHGYQLKYTLHRGDGTVGGLDEAGGAMTLSQGRFLESWGEYCIDNNGNVFPKGSSPNPPPWNEDSGSGSAIIPPDGSYVWIDVIRLYQKPVVACDGVASLEVLLVDSLGNYNQVSYPFSSSGVTGQTIQKSFTNNTNAAVEYTLSFTFHKACDYAIDMNGGSYSLTDVKKPAPSYAKFWGVEVTNNKPIWIGGCNGSTVDVRVYDELNQTVYTKSIGGSGRNGLKFGDLTPQSSYSKFRVEITTTQNAEVSPVTGKSYETQFKLIDFKLYENWKYVPVFGSELQFFVDGSLVDTLDEAGGYTTVSYPVPKGAHQYLWRFKTNIPPDQVVFDYADIDFIKLTNWLCQSVTIIPYCEAGGGDKSVEALIKCLLKIIKDRIKVCVIGKKTWIFT